MQHKSADRNHPERLPCGAAGIITPFYVSLVGAAANRDIKSALKEGSDPEECLVNKHWTTFLSQHKNQGQSCHVGGFISVLTDVKPKVTKTLN